MLKEMTVTVFEYSGIEREEIRRAAGWLGHKTSRAKMNHKSILLDTVYDGRLSELARLLKTLSSPGETLTISLRSAQQIKKTVDFFLKLDGKSFQSPQGVMVRCILRDLLSHESRILVKSPLQVAVI